MANSLKQINFFCYKKSDNQDKKGEFYLESDDSKFPKEGKQYIEEFFKENANILRIIKKDLTEIKCNQVDQLLKSVENLLEKLEEFDWLLLHFNYYDNESKNKEIIERLNKIFILQDSSIEQTVNNVCLLVKLKTEHNVDIGHSTGLTFNSYSLDYSKLTAIKLVDEDRKKDKFTHSDRIKELNLSANKLTTLEESFFGKSINSLKYLYTLNLANNNLETIAGTTFDNLKNLITYNY